MKIPDHLIKAKSVNTYENRIPLTVLLGVANMAIEFIEKTDVNPDDVLVGFWEDAGGYHLDIGHKDTFDEQAVKYKRMFTQ